MVVVVFFCIYVYYEICLNDILGILFLEELGGLWCLGFYMNDIVIYGLSYDDLFDLVFMCCIFCIIVVFVRENVDVSGYGRLIFFIEWIGFIWGGVEVR